MKKYIDHVELNEETLFTSLVFMAGNLVFIMEYIFGDPIYRMWETGFFAGMIEIGLVWMAYTSFRKNHYQEIIEVRKK